VDRLSLRPLRSPAVALCLAAAGCGPADPAPGSESGRGPTEDPAEQSGDTGTTGQLPSGGNPATLGVANWLREGPGVPGWAHGHDLTAWAVPGGAHVFAAAWQGTDRLYSTGASGITEIWADATARASHGVARGDLDGDGTTDVAVAVKHGESGAWLLGGDAPVWRPLPGAAGAKAVAVGDVDGDGRSDVVLGIQGANRLYRQTDDGFELRWTAERRLESDSVQLADLDGDGRPELLVGNSSGDGQPNQVFAFVDGAPQLRWTSPEDHMTNQIRACDLDGDGAAEFIEANSMAPNRIRRWTAGEAETVWQDHNAVEVVGVACADGDGDGDLDLAFASPAGGWIVWNDAGTWTPGGRFGEAVAPEAVEWIDVDGDTRPDLIVAQQGEPWVRWWTNAGRPAPQGAAGTPNQ